MDSLYILIETFTSGYKVEVLDILSLVSSVVWNTCYHK